MCLITFQGTLALYAIHKKITLLSFTIIIEAPDNMIY